MIKGNIEIALQRLYDGKVLWQLVGGSISLHASFERRIRVEQKEGVTREDVAQKR
ncbi:MAG: hypothetical protein N2170_09265 [Bacteroidia bacterium]|nr:hypothetical protein [Bacteroidia bacterium]